jgi:hypothetical protein
MPERERAIITGFSYAVSAETAFDAPRGARVYDEEHWLTIRTIAADIGVKAATREDADALRNAFVSRPELYVDTAGADGATTNDPAYPHRLVLELVRREREPIADLDRFLQTPSAGTLSDHDAADDPPSDLPPDAASEAPAEARADRDTDAAGPDDNQATSAHADGYPSTEESVEASSSDEPAPADAEATDAATGDGGER